MSPYDTILSIMNDMTENELNNFSELMCLYHMCRDRNERDLFMFATRSYMRNKFFTTYIEPSKNN